MYLTPWTTDTELAADWFERFEGAGLDGVVAKPLDGVYTPGERTLVKVKHQRTADCVVAGFRWHKDGKGVGSLLLGLFDDAGKLHHVGVCGRLHASRPGAELVDELAPLRDDALDDHPWREWAVAEAHAARPPARRASAAGTRPEGPVVGAAAARAGGRGRLRPAPGRPVPPRHARFVRWRPDREPSSCRYDQLEVAEPVALSDVLVRGPETGPAR